jgi:hypothetical protein
MTNARKGSPSAPPPAPRRQTGSPLADKREPRISLKIEFADASNSSLDYAIIADFDKSLAHHHKFLIRAQQRLVVDCCLANQREIPFTQINPRNAYPSTSPPSHERTAPKTKRP